MSAAAFYALYPTLRTGIAHRSITEPHAAEDPPLQAFCADLKHRRSFTGR